MKINLKPIEQQVIVVTGATSGIGLETAHRFAQRGARLVLVGRDQGELDATLAEVRAEGADGITVIADMADWNQVNQVAMRAIEAYGRIDTWAHVAGVALFAKMEDTSADEFHRVIDVNLNGPTYGVLAALPHIKKQKSGAIIIVTSVNARIPLPYQGAYVAAKHGLDGMISTLRLELEHDEIPISITNIIPATINTPFFAKARTKIGVAPNAAPPVYSPAAVADAILYAAEHPVKELSIGSVTLMYQTVNRLSHRMFGADVKAIAFNAQRTTKKKTVQAPDNLYEHIEGYHQVEGEFGGGYSKLTWMELHPPVRYALLGLLLIIPTGIYFWRSQKMKAARTPKGISERVIGQVTTTAAGLVALIASRRRKKLPARVADRIKKTLPDHLPSFGRRSNMDKFLSKAADLTPKGLTFLHSETLPEKMVRMVKNTFPKDILRRKQNDIPHRAARMAAGVIEPVGDLSKRARKTIDQTKKSYEDALDSGREAVADTIKRYRK